MVTARRRADPAVCTPLRTFEILHSVRSFPFSVDDKLRLELLRREGLDVLDLCGPGARAAMLTVPFF